MPSHTAPSSIGLSALAGLIALAVVSPPLAAQVAVEEHALLQGVVADETTWEPIASATITLVGTGIETRSSAIGSFAFPDAPLGPVSVRVQAPGYPAVVEEVEVNPDVVLFIQFMLPNIDAILDGLLVRGTARGDAASRGDARTAADLLARELPGIQRNSGIVGQNNSPILLRGISSISLSGEPDLYLDGVRMTGGIGRALDVLSQIPANDVKDIRVLRGPASAFLQGSANGAIYVETKSGPDDQR